MMPPRALLEQAKRRLGVARLVLAIHDASFPSEDGEDIGRGTPFGRGGAQLLAFAHELGFDAIQLGPHGMTSAFNPSPYDGTIFARDPLSIAAAGLVEDALLPGEHVARLLDERPPQAAAHHCDPARAEVLSARLIDEAWAAARDKPEIVARVARFREEHAAWLVPAALYDRLASWHGEGDFTRWSSDRELWTSPRRARERGALRASARGLVDRFAFGQLLLHRQHQAFRKRAAHLGLSVYGDLQVGMAPRDAWAFGAALLEGYRLGAPPSRTNPEGQPWGYPVLHPAQRQPRSPAYELMRARLRKMFGEYDAIRIDHPHGLVCPWVYRADESDPFAAVARGARLFESPDLADHPALARFSLVRPDQLNRDRPRHADDWVIALEREQIDAYATFVDLALASAADCGHGPESIVCEVLSTRPLPLFEVTQRHALGRFRVTQKADDDDPGDPYRAAGAATEDWVMVSTHDTETIWALFEHWSDAERARRAAHLARALGHEPAIASRWAQSADDLARAELAELFACPAQQVMIFFGDLFGLRERYNTPGTVGPPNWRLRLTADFAARYRAGIGSGGALDLAGALALALRARGDGDLAAALEAAAR